MRQVRDYKTRLPTKPNAHRHGMTPIWRRRVTKEEAYAEWLRSLQAGRSMAGLASPRWWTLVGSGDALPAQAFHYGMTYRFLESILSQILELQLGRADVAIDGADGAGELARQRGTQ